MSPPAYSPLASRARAFSSPVFLPAARLRFFFGFSCATPPDADSAVAAAAAGSPCGIACSSAASPPPPPPSSVPSPPPSMPAAAAAHAACVRCRGRRRPGQHRAATAAGARAAASAVAAAVAAAAAQRARLGAAQEPPHDALRVAAPGRAVAQQPQPLSLSQPLRKLVHRAPPVLRLCAPEAPVDSQLARPGHVGGAGARRRLDERLEGVTDAISQALVVLALAHRERVAIRRRAADVHILEARQRPLGRLVVDVGDAEALLRRVEPQQERVRRRPRPCRQRLRRARLSTVR